MSDAFIIKVDGNFFKKNHILRMGNQEVIVLKVYKNNW